MSTSLMSQSSTPKLTKRDPRSLTNLPDILSCLSLHQSEETELSNSLAASLSSPELIFSSFSRLQALTSHLDELHAEALLLSTTVSSTAKTAQRVGGRVRCLDEEVRRVREAGEWVGQVIDLKSSLALLQSSIENQDWESATRHCARAMALPPEVISGPFAEFVVPTSESHLPPVQTLQAGREQLLAIFHRCFDQASRSRDAAATSRFFKLFPTIGWEAEGLQVYASFVVGLVRVMTPGSAKTSSPLYYVAALTALFENISMVVDQHQAVVEKYYGLGKMTTVIECLLEECDRVVKGLLDGWEEERSMKRKLSDITSSATGQYLFPINRKQHLQSTVEENVDPREIDKVLTEVAGMASRWGLFRKFLSENSKDDCLNPDSAHDSKYLISRSSPSRLTLWPASKDLQVIESTASHKNFENLLSTYYIPLEIWYARAIIDKAHRLSTQDLSQSIAATTTPDDVFYILRIILSRLLSTGSVRVVKWTLESLQDAMDGDFIGVLKKKLDEVYRTPGVIGPGARGDKGERESRSAFIILLNDLDVSSSHLERLTKDFLAYFTISQHFLVTEQQSVKDSLSSFSSALSAKFRSGTKVGVEQLFNQVMRPKLRTLIPDVYKDISYLLDDHAYSVAEYHDFVRKRFIKIWESLMDGYKDTFTHNNYRLFFEFSLNVLLRPWEKFVVSFKFTELGAIRFDRDLRSITTYLSSQTVFGDTRDKFLRLQQISTLLNLDSEEDVEEFYNGSGITWKLSAQEARVIAGLRV